MRVPLNGNTAAEIVEIDADDFEYAEIWQLATAFEEVARLAPEVRIRATYPDWNGRIVIGSIRLDRIDWDPLLVCSLNGRSTKCSGSS